jgi:hypothetical protein
MFSVAALIGFVLGALGWWMLAPQIGLDERLRGDARPVWQLLLTGGGVSLLAAIVTGLLAGSNSGIVGGALGWMATLTALVFWAYVGAAAYTALRAARLRRSSRR